MACMQVYSNNVMENAKWVPKEVIPIPAYNSDTRPPDFAILSWWWINNIVPKVYLLIVLLYRLKTTLPLIHVCGVINTGGGVSIQVAYSNSWRLVQCWRPFATAWAPASPIPLYPTLYMNNKTYYHNSWSRIHVTNGCIRIHNYNTCAWTMTMYYARGT